ncbi:MAG: DUF5522 domain-containing protein [Luteibaculaceae bacterium]
MSSNNEDMSMFSPKNKLLDGDFYLSEEGYMVFTEQYLKRRGYCCKNGCRHCPWGFKINKAR